MVSALGEGIMTIADGPEMPSPRSMTSFPRDSFVPGNSVRHQPHHFDSYCGDRRACCWLLGMTAKRAKLIPGRWQGVVESADRLRARQHRLSGDGRAAWQALCADDHHPVLHDLRFQSVRHHSRLNMAANATVVMPLWCSPCGASASTGSPASARRASATILRRAVPPGRAVAGLYPAGPDSAA